MSRTDKMIYAFLILTSLMLVGMIMGSWRVVLYPYLIVIGLSILLGMTKEVKANPRKIWIPITVSLIYLTLFIIHDFITMNSPTGGNGYILGLTPAMALFVFGIWPMAVLVCLLYMWTFSTDESIQTLNESKNKNIEMEG